MIEHTPVVPIYQGKGWKRKHIGGVCRHCGMLLTPAGNPSQPSQTVSVGKSITRVRKTKAHEARVRATTKKRRWIRG